MLGNITREQQLIILGLILLIIVGSGVTLYRRHLDSSPGETIPLQSFGQNLPAPVFEKQIVVYVCGEVVEEGVYKLKEGARLVDLIQLSGGLSPGADVAALNLAELVKDGQKITIPRKKTVTASKQSGSSSNGKVNINTASVAALTKIPGIGRSTAEQIVQHRQSKGRFNKLEDITKVPRIGKAKLSKIKPYISVN